MKWVSISKTRLTILLTTTHVLTIQAPTKLSLFKFYAARTYKCKRFLKIFHTENNGIACSRLVTSLHNRHFIRKAPYRDSHSSQGTNGRLVLLPLQPTYQTRTSYSFFWDIAIELPTECTLNVIKY